MTAIHTTCQVGKSLAIKLTKEDDTELVMASLPFSEALVTRDDADELLGVPLGWSQRLFDELGAPAFRGSISLDGLDLDCAAVVKGSERDRLEIRGGATLTKITLELQPLGFLLSGTFTWAISGDESGDAEELLGHLCRLELEIVRPQADLLKPAAAPPDDVPPDRHNRISSADEVRHLLEKKGYHLRGAEPNYWVEKPDGSGKRGVWLNAARSVLKLPLEPIGDDEAGDEVGRWKWKGKAA